MAGGEEGATGGEPEDSRLAADLLVYMLRQEHCWVTQQRWVKRQNYLLLQVATLDDLAEGALAQSSNDPVCKRARRRGQ